MLEKEIFKRYKFDYNKLLDYGYKFSGDTDSEVLCALIDHYCKDNDDIVYILGEIVKEIKGSFACAIIRDDDNKIYGGTIQAANNTANIVSDVYSSGFITFVNSGDINISGVYNSGDLSSSNNSSFINTHSSLFFSSTKFTSCFKIP